MLPTIQRGNCYKRFKNSLLERNAVDALLKDWKVDVLFWLVPVHRDAEQLVALYREVCP